MKKIWEKIKGFKVTQKNVGAVMLGIGTVVIFVAEWITAGILNAVILSAGVVGFSFLFVWAFDKIFSRLPKE